MNWTGGRLHRHIKANTNAQVKTQKHHFAKARQDVRRTRVAPRPNFSILRDFQTASTRESGVSGCEPESTTSNPCVRVSKVKDPTLVGERSRNQKPHLNSRQGLTHPSQTRLTHAAGRVTTTTLSTTSSTTCSPVQTGSD